MTAQRAKRSKARDYVEFDEPDTNETEVEADAPAFVGKRCFKSNEQFYRCTKAAGHAGPHTFSGGEVRSTL